jgi:hypothetical protein
MKIKDAFEKHSVQAKAYDSRSLDRTIPRTTFTRSITGLMVGTTAENA